MFRPLFVPSHRVSRAVLPLLALVLTHGSVLAGNQHGPGWQQVKKKKEVRPVGGEREMPKQPLPVSGTAMGLTERVVPTEEMVQGLVPAAGPLNEDALIRLAIANDPTLARRRGEVLISRAREKGAGDWDNPELRIGYAWDSDDRIREPFIERSTETLTASERYSSSRNTGNLAPEFFPGNGDSNYLRTSGTVNSSRYRTIEKKVTPGRFRDVIETTVYDKRSATDRSRRSSTDTFGAGGTADVNEARSERSNRQIVERSKEIVNHPDEYTRDDQLSLLVRFRLPNPWERRAKIEKAAAETARAESDYLIEEDKVVRTVRAIYEELNATQNLSRSTVERRKVQDQFRTEIEAANLADLADLAADMRLQSGKAIRDQREQRSDLARLREELASYCGVERPERIVVTGVQVRRVVATEALDVDYLTSMAQLHRSDLLDLQSRLSVAQAELREAKAAKIPFFTFLDAGWDTSTTTGRTGENEQWSVRAGITLPLFDWVGINKAKLEHETATETYSRQIETQRQRIGNEIRQAIDRIRASAKELKRYEADFAQVKADSERSMREMAVDPIKSLKTRYQTEDLLSKFEEDRYEIWSDYYKSVMELERALGTRLERVMAR